MPCFCVGYGATVGSDGRPIDPDMEPISATEAEALLLRDLESSQGWVSRLIKTALTENQFSAKNRRRTFLIVLNRQETLWGLSVPFMGNMSDLGA